MWSQNSGGLPETMLTRHWHAKQMLSQTLRCDEQLPSMMQRPLNPGPFFRSRWVWKLVIQLLERAFLNLKQHISPFMWSKKSLFCLIFITLWNEVSAVGVTLMPACWGGSVSPVTLRLCSVEFPIGKCTPPKWDSDFFLKSFPISYSFFTIFFDFIHPIISESPTQRQY